MPWMAASDDLARLGIDLPGGSSARLRRFAAWLGSEGAEAGLIGPDERDDLWSRHLLDSAAFGLAWPQAPSELIDIGSGGGLPGVVLAIIWPGTRVTLLDRSGRRTRLLRRLVRILELDNVVVMQADVDHTRFDAGAMVMRAVFPPERAIGFFADRLAPGGRGVLALSRQSAPDEAALVRMAGEAGLAATVLEVSVLDPPAWLLIMEGP